MTGVQTCALPISLDSRIDREFWESLGIDVVFHSNEENLPMKIKGPMKLNELTLDCSKTSQYLSGILLSMPTRNNGVILTIEGDIVSRRHAELSFSIAADCGSPNQFENPKLNHWKCEPPSSVEIPPDASHIAFWKLYEILQSLRFGIVSADFFALSLAAFFTLLNSLRMRSLDWILSLRGSAISGCL